MDKNLAHTADFHDEAPLVKGDLTFHDITEIVSAHTEKKTPLAWFGAFGLALSGLMLMLVMIAYLFWNGTGVWGLNNPVGWGYAIVNFVFLGGYWPRWNVDFGYSLSV